MMKATISYAANQNQGEVVMKINNFALTLTVLFTLLFGLISVGCKPQIRDIQGITSPDEGNTKVWKIVHVIGLPSGKYILTVGPQGLIEVGGQVEVYQDDLLAIMELVGAPNTEELKKVPLYFENDNLMEKDRLVTRLKIRARAMAAKD